MKKLLGAFMACASIFTLVGCKDDDSSENDGSKQSQTTDSGQTGNTDNNNSADNSNSTVINNNINIITGDTTKEVKKPKYVFLFIGDGMSYPQIQATSYYLGATGSNGGVVQQDLSFMNFETTGSAQTFDSTSFCPDSASTATSIATGKKTYSGTINMDTTFKIKYDTIAEQLKAQQDYKIGVVTSVNLNHATPAAFYAHQASRNSYYAIGEELIASNFDYFAGGELLQPGTGADNLYTKAEAAGYNVVKTQAEAKALKASDGKSIVVAETIADAGSMSYQIDASADEWKLSDYVSKGIDMLDNDKGFFMMVEGGKIDWACHANDAASTIHDTIALSHAVDEAISFYNSHKDETLILVTGDHETGGLTIGYAGTNYDTYLTNLKNQKISFAKFDSDIASSYTSETSFETVLADVKQYFGLSVASGSNVAKSGNLVLTDYEYSLLEAAYNKQIKNTTLASAQELGILYGSYKPISVTVTHILNNKSGISFSSYAHTGIPVPVFAQGAGAENFSGYYDNTDIYKTLASLTGIC